MYNDIIIDNFTNPLHVGDIDNPHYEFEIGNPVCGDRIKIQLLLDDDAIHQVAFRAWGCATSVATANIFCSSIHGLFIPEIAARTKLEIEDMLGELEPSQHHCLHILHELHQKLICEARE